MTREEAIKYIKQHKVVQCGTCMHQQEGVLCEKCGFPQAIDMAIEALRREKPKNPVINFVSDADGSRRLNKGWREDALLCPVCHTYFGEVFEEGYCRECGQKLIQKRVKVVEE